MPILMFKPVPIDGESMLKFRYLLEFPIESGTETYYIHLKSKPTLKIDKGPYPYKNGPYIPSKYEWEPIEITIIDSVGPTGSTKLLEWINLSYYNPKIGKSISTTDVKKNIRISQLDPVGVTTETWLLMKCYLDIRTEKVETIEDLELKLDFDSAFLHM